MTARGAGAETTDPSPGARGGARLPKVDLEGKSRPLTLDAG